MSEPTLEDTTAGGPAAPSPAAGPLGNPNGAAPLPVVSIVDTILDLDELLSADVRRAEKTARFCIEPWLEAEIDELEAELALLVDANGNPLPAPEAALEDVLRRAEQVSAEIYEKRMAMGRAFRSVRMGQLPADDWREFKARYRTVIDAGAPYPSEFHDELISVTALRPKISLEQARELRSKYGDPQLHELSSKAWDVNEESGVSIPKSPTSSHVLRRAQRGRN